MTSPTREYVLNGNSILATIDSSGTRYHHPDHLSPRLLTNSAQSAVGHLGQFPFGEIWYDDIAPGTKYKFTTYERDAESGNDYGIARSYLNRLGRFSSLDQVSGEADPQSLTRYSYVKNDPINRRDPLGLCDTVIAGFGRGQKDAGVADYASLNGTNVAYPFSGLGPVESYLATVFATAGVYLVAANDLLNTIAQTPPNQLSKVTTFSGGAAVFSDIYAILPENLSSRIGDDRPTCLPVPPSEHPWP